MAEYDDERANLRKLLAEELKSQRTRRGWSLRDLETKTTYNHTYLHRVETGEQLPSDALARALDDLYETGGLLHRILEAIRDGSIKDHARVAVKKEGKAERIQVFTSNLVPGLLQTEEYMRALFSAAKPNAPDAVIDADVAARLNRQRIFERKEPPIYWALMDEAALARSIGGKECMARQLEHVIRVGLAPNVTVQVYPFDRGGYPMLGGSLNLLTLPDGEHLAHVESFASGELVESPKRIMQLTQRFDVARAHALNPEESLELIRKYTEDLGHDHP